VPRRRIDHPPLKNPDMDAFLSARGGCLSKGIRYCHLHTGGSSGFAEREDLEECARILGVQCAHYQSKFGKLPMSLTLEVLNSETMDDTQATWIADGFELVVAVLGVLERAHPKH
jgi:hypothetical protein